MSLEGDMLLGRGYGPGGGTTLPPPVDKMTHTCENITFPQRRWWTVGEGKQKHVFHTSENKTEHSAPVSHARQMCQ